MKVNKWYEFWYLLAMLRLDPWPQYKSVTIHVYVFVAKYFLWMFININAFSVLTVFQSDTQVRLKIPHHNSSMKYLFTPNPHGIFICRTDCNKQAVSCQFFVSVFFLISVSVEEKIANPQLRKNISCNQTITMHANRTLREI